MAKFTIPNPEPVKSDFSNRSLLIQKTTTFSPGTLIPILCKDVLPGDDFKVNIDSLIESLPMVAPNLNGYKASFDFFYCPWSNYYGFMNNNKRSSASEVIDRNRITYTVGVGVEYGASGVLSTIVENSVKPGSLLDYLGLPSGFSGRWNESAVEPCSFPAEKLLSVLDIYRNYYVNNQEGTACFCDPNEAVTDNNKIYRVDISLLDEVFEAVRFHTRDDGKDLTEIFGRYSDSAEATEDLQSFWTEFQACMLSGVMGGLPLRTYRMDLNRGVMSEDVGSTKAVINVVNGSVDVDQIRFLNKLQILIDRIDLSGGRFSDYMRVRWNRIPRIAKQVPIHLGSCSSFFGVTDVIATASGMNSTESLSGRGNSVLGQQAGFAVGGVERNNHPISFSADQYGTFVCMFSLTPIVTYSQGIEREDLKTKFADIYDPAFARLGYQDVDPMELSVFPYLTQTVFAEGVALAAPPLQPLTQGQSVGKRIAWSEYMSALPRAHGLFASGEDLDYWVNNRLYTDEKSVSGGDYGEYFKRYGETSYSTYIYPYLVNNLFADTAFDAQNFRLRVTFDISAKRPIGSRIMPHL